MPRVLFAWQRLAARAPIALEMPLAAVIRTVAFVAGQTVRHR